MALRLILVGVVACLALELPDRGASKPTDRPGKTWLDVPVQPRTAAEGFVAIAPPVVSEPEIPALPLSPVVVDLMPETVETSVPVAPVEVTIAAETGAPAVLTLPGRIEAAFVASVEPFAPEVEAAPTNAPDLISIDAIARALAESSPTVATVAEPSPPVFSDQQGTTPSVGILADIAPVTIVEPVVVIASESKPLDPDATFQSVVGEMARTFAADVPARMENAPLIASQPIPAPPAPEAELIVAADEPADAPEDSPSLADILNREAEGLEPIPLPDPVAVAEVSPEPVAPQAPETREHRLAHAVSLTGQAVQAWASLLVQRPAVISVHR